MNQDDAIARGCALRSAMFYPAYQMKEFALEDPFDLVMEASKLPTEKSVAELLKIEVYYYLDIHLLDRPKKANQNNVRGRDDLVLFLLREQINREYFLL